MASASTASRGGIHSSLDQILRPYDRRIRLWIIIAVAYGVLSGCVADEPPSIRLGIANAAVSLDPRYATDATSDRINRLIYRRLTDFDENFEVEPELADWTVMSPTRYRFHLGHEGREFHNGSFLTSADVRASYESIIAPGSVSPHKGALQNIAEIRTPDADTVDFVLHRQDPLFPARLSIGIMPEALLKSGHDFGHQPIGSGPLRLEQWREDDRLSLIRMRDGQRIEIFVNANASMRALMLARGQLDLLAGDMPPEIVEWLQQRADLGVIRRRGTSFTYLGFNMQDPVLSEPAVRYAVAIAIDRGAIINHLMLGQAQRASSILPPTHWALAPELQSLPYDPELARSLLSEHGYGPERPLQLSYKTSSNPFRLRLAAVLQDQLGRVGVRLDIDSYDWGTFYADIKAGRFQLYSLSWVGLKIPDVFRYVFHSKSVPPMGANRGRYRNTLVDELIERADSAATRREQVALYARVQEQLLVDLPYVPLWYEDNVAIFRRELIGYTLSPDGNLDALNSTYKRKQ